jgi:hypothetical protein
MNSGTEIKVTRELDPTYGFIYKIDPNGNGNGYLYEVDGIKYISIFGDIIISAWERKATTPITEVIQLANDDTIFIKSYPSGLFKLDKILCDDFTVVDTKGHIVSDMSLAYEEELDSDGNSFDPIVLSQTFKTGYNTQYQFYLDNIGNPIIFKAVFDVIKGRI